MAKATPKKTEIKKLLPILESDEYDSSEDMARVLLDVMLNDIMPKREKWFVVGQVWPRKGSVISDKEGKDLRVALGPFDTRGKATAAGESLALNHATGEQAKWWAMEVWHGTPADWYNKLKAKHQRKNLLDSEDPRTVRLAMREAFWEENPGATSLPEHLKGFGWDGLEEFQEFLDEERGKDD